MNRRHFISTAALTGLATASAAKLQAAASTDGKDLIELRVYSFDSNSQEEAFEQFLQKTALPALNQLGIQPVGVFRLSKEDNPKLEAAYDRPLLFVLLPHKSMDSVVRLTEQLAGNSEFVTQGRATLEAPKNAPAYKRFESSLFLAFDHAPRVQTVSQSPDRRLQLRIYESHNDERALKKIEMYNQGGEIAIFKRCGMPPVFFGTAVAGDRLPNLTYLLGFANPAEMDAAWKRFRDHPDWLSLKADPQYKDTANKITNIVLRPSKGSQL